MVAADVVPASGYRSLRHSSVSTTPTVEVFSLGTARKPLSRDSRALCGQRGPAPEAFDVVLVDAAARLQIDSG